MRTGGGPRPLPIGYGLLSQQSSSTHRRVSLMDKTRVRGVPRKTHTKSRRGCQQCKDGHVKCDEKQPACSLCIKREVACTYSATPKLPSNRASSTPRSNESEDHRAACKTPSRERLYEMRLFHHFLTKTICTLGSSAHLKFLWETVVPHYATSHDYVMDSILAIAALHIASANPEDSQAYMCSALDYYTRALAGSRASIASGNMQDADACAVCSICILVAATAYSNNSQEKNARDPLDDILEKRRILKGTRFFMQGLDRASMHPLLEEWCFGDMDKGNDVEFPEEYRTHDVIYSTHQLINFRLNPKMESLHGEIVERLGELGSELENSFPPDKEVLKTAHRLLKDAIRYLPVYAGLMNWSLEISDEFIQLLKQGNWLARVLFMFYGLGLHISSERWTFKDSGRCLVTQILPRKSEVDPRWVDLVTWVGDSLE